MKTAGAVVTNRGGRTCHAAIIARELGIPAIVGAGEATAALREGESVTVSCAEGDVGRVYRGQIPFEVQRTDLAQTPVRGHRSWSTWAIGPRLQDLVPAQRRRRPGAHGVHHQRVDPGAPDGAGPPGAGRGPGDRAAIERLTAGYGRPADLFVERLSEGVGMIAAAFYPKPVIVRLSDFKSNEYAALLGGGRSSRSRRIR